MGQALQNTDAEDRPVEDRGDSGIPRDMLPSAEAKDLPGLTEAIGAAGAKLYVAPLYIHIHCTLLSARARHISAHRPPRRATHERTEDFTPRESTRRTTLDDAHRRGDD